MKYGNPKIQSLNKTAFLLRWNETPDDDFLSYLLSLKSFLQKEFSAEITHTYNEILLRFSTANPKAGKKLDRLISAFDTEPKNEKRARKLHHLPVCYDPKFGLDIPLICEINKLSEEELLSLHSRPSYLVYFIGFLPGFLYLQGLNEKLHINRRAVPRKRIPAGAVGIAGEQTGIYPHASPAGWQLIGNCPIPLFDAKKDPPSIFSPADRIQFVPVDLQEHQKITDLLRQGKYNHKITDYEH